ncbi:esterase/lipase family protein [Rhodococcus sp. NPDC056506]|uniref:esterase/lipase family protein n=2 Tax=unclassified Rhodococcus (in: high G+C Gram-positive bacteria) TaxID=192944 RepID=UPI00366CCCE4
MHRIRLFGGVVLAALMLVGFTSVASAQAPLPVPNAFLAGVPQELGNPGGSAPGSNDFSCKPTAEHPNPVVLVHGTGGNRQTNWATYAPLLANEGYCVFALTYGNFPEQPWPLSAIGGMQEIPSSAAQLSNFVDQVLGATGATSVDLIGHSQGTIINGYYAKFLGGADKVDNIVSVASLWKGTLGNEQASIGRSLRELGVSEAAQAGFPICKACLNMGAGSEFIENLRAGGVYAPGVHYTNITTRYDELVLPYTNGLESGPNATNIVVQDGCEQDISDHLAIAASLRAATFALNALDPAHQRPVPCNSVLPVVG